MMTTTTTRIKVGLIVTAAGESRRFGRGKKEFAKLGGKTVLSLCLENFLKAADFDKIVVTFPKNCENEAKNAAFSSDFMQNFAKAAENSQKIAFVEGGSSRQKSVFNALLFLRDFQPKIVLIHDGARPWLSEKVVLDAIFKAQKFGASCPVVPLVDTPKICADEKIVRHLARKTVFSAQTPQAFDFERIFRAHEKAAETCREWTDDSEIFAEFEGEVAASAGDEKNRKITFANDLRGEKIFRAGLGYDLHPLVFGRDLILGGVKIPCEKGEAGHSDGDALLHAVCDALLGAAAKSDIGELFPPNDPQFKGANSADLLQAAWQPLFDEGWRIENIDCVINIEKPKILPFRAEICQNIAKILKIPAEKVFVKAKTGEKLGKIGEERAVCVWANCLLSKFLS